MSDIKHARITKLARMNYIQNTLPQNEHYHQTYLNITEREDTTINTEITNKSLEISSGPLGFHLERLLFFASRQLLSVLLRLLSVLASRRRSCFFSLRRRITRRRVLLWIC